MKEKLKNALKCTQLFVKKNKMSCICFLLAVLVTISGTFSFAKYISGDSISKRPGAATMHASSEITGVSALSFTNTDFWGGDLSNDDKEDDIPMNSLRSIDISVKNYELDALGNKQTSNVRMEYELTFNAPKAFAENLAFQLLDADDHAITTQMIMGHFFEALEKEHVHHLSNGEALYNGVDFVDSEGNFVDLLFEIDHNEDSEGKVHAVCTAIHPDHGCEYAGEKLIITVDEIVETVDQTLLFRAWDTSDLKMSQVTNELGELLPPVRAVIETDIPMYRVSIFMERFVLEPGEEATEDFIMTIAPTEALHDDHLGAFICVDGGTDSNGETVYVTPDTLKSGDTVYFSAITETVYESNTNLGILADWGEPKASYHVAGVKTYSLGEVISVETHNYADVEDVDNISHSKTNSEVTVSENAPNNIVTDDDATEMTFYFIRSGNGNNRVYNIQEAYTNTNTSARDFNNNSNGYKVEVETLKKTTTISYSTYATGKHETAGSETVTKTVVEKVGDDYIIKIIKQRTETSSEYTHLTVTKTETVTYEIENYSIYQANRSGYTYNWSKINGAQISDYTNMADGINTYLSSLSKTSDPTLESIPNQTNAPGGVLSTATIYEKVAHVRNSASAETQIISLSQMIYNPDGSVGTIYFDSAENALQFYGQDPDDTSKTIQTFFLSNCYSKDYPVAVRVIFRQIQ